MGGKFDDLIFKFKNISELTEDQIESYRFLQAGELIPLDTPDKILSFDKTADKKISLYCN